MFSVKKALPLLIFFVASRDVGHFVASKKRATMNDFDIYFHL